MLDFIRSEYGDQYDPSTHKEMAVSDALDEFGAEVSMQDFAQMLEEAGGLKKIEATIIERLI